MSKRKDWTAPFPFEEDTIADVVQDVPIDDFYQGLADIVSIAITPNSTVVTTIQAVATATMSDGSTRDVTTAAGIEWASSDATKATVSAGGLITGVADGTTTITAKLGGVTGSRTYTVDVA